MTVIASPIPPDRRYRPVQEDESCKDPRANGNLYVASGLSNQVLRYNGGTGAFLDSFASGGVSIPTSLTFGPDGNLYVSTAGTDQAALHKSFDGGTAS